MSLRIKFKLPGAGPEEVIIEWSTKKLRIAGPADRCEESNSVTTWFASVGEIRKKVVAKLNEKKSADDALLPADVVGLLMCDAAEFELESESEEWSADEEDIVPENNNTTPEKKRIAEKKRVPATGEAAPSETQHEEGTVLRDEEIVVCADSSKSHAGESRARIVAADGLLTLQAFVYGSAESFAKNVAPELLKDGRIAMSRVVVPYIVAGNPPQMRAITQHWRALAYLVDAETAKILLARMEAHLEALASSECKIEVEACMVELLMRSDVDWDWDHLVVNNFDATRDSGRRPLFRKCLSGERISFDDNSDTEFPDVARALLQRSGMATLKRLAPMLASEQVDDRVYSGFFRLLGVGLDLILSNGGLCSDSLLLDFFDSDVSAIAREMADTVRIPKLDPKLVLRLFSVVLDSCDFFCDDSGYESELLELLRRPDLDWRWAEFIVGEDSDNGKTLLDQIVDRGNLHEVKAEILRRNIPAWNARMSRAILSFGVYYSQFLEELSRYLPEGLWAEVLECIAASDLDMLVEFLGLQKRFHDDEGAWSQVAWSQVALSQVARSHKLKGRMPLLLRILLREGQGQPAAFESMAVEILKGSELSESELASVTDADGSSVLHIACRLGWSDVVREILSRPEHARTEADCLIRACKEWDEASCVGLFEVVVNRVATQDSYKRYQRAELFARRKNKHKIAKLIRDAVSSYESD